MRAAVVGWSPVIMTTRTPARFAVVPWTINDPDTMAAQIDAGADGIISDFPTVLRSVMDKRGMDLPTPYPAK